jgi:hypothetical protein
VRQRIGDFVRQEVARDAHILVVGTHDLLHEVGRLRLASEASQAPLAPGPRCPGGHILGGVHPVGPAGDAVAVTVRGIDVGENCCLGDGFDEPDAKDRWRQPQRNRGARRHLLGIRSGDGLVLNLWAA